MNKLNNYNNSPMVIVPDITKQKIKAAEDIGPISAGLILTIVLLTQRAQIAATLLKMGKQEIQQLPSVKWNAKQIAKEPTVRSFISRLVVADTLNYELSAFKGLDINEAKEKANRIAEDLSQSTPIPGAKILSPRAVNSNNLNSHRLALMSRQIGTWQAKPIYDPMSIIKNIPIATLTAENLGRMILLIHQNLEIECCNIFLDTLNQSTSKEPHVEAVRAVIDEYLQYNSNEDGIILFDDAIDLNTEDNKIPLESFFTFIERTKPLRDIEDVKLPIEKLTSPLFNYALSTNEKINKDIRKHTPTKKATPANTKTRRKRESQ